ncbi:prepilin-type N-terminal cleavage/methylation domain-containing protein [Motiliproteus coralliicola]|uniref:Prepilin-type N-terminal cleavage/methylation domain-containing protein n=1 Tax=Motiliproteus coralliicola TaxID=2283196 RepID=A0A369WDU1_9GAMM|nr:prepilin-type N-terminal cleavage/methylation domain-containing protein [Motiliproteus coralliicola]RDE18864.1 prepilin-type N-terminal cleavage/methylation domain-containing protein [Motiliproteus coralliicola]
MQPDLKRRQSGFSLLELVVVGLVILVVATASYRQYMSLVVDAEIAAFNGVRGWLQAGVNLAMSDAISGRAGRRLEDLDGTNPMVLLDSAMVPPSNYLGELSGLAAQQAEPGNWYFDLDQRALFYRFRYRQAMPGFEQAPDDRVGFELKLLRSRADNPNNRDQQTLRLEFIPLY